MLRLVLLCLTLSGLQALPLAPRGGLDKTAYRLPNVFRQGTEPSRRFLVDLNTGQVKEHVSEMDRRTDFIGPSLGKGWGEMDRRHWLTNKAPVDIPDQRNGGGWVRMEEPSARGLPDGFRQGTEPMISLPDGFRQGTEPMISLPDGFRQGTEPMISLPDGFRQGTEPINSLPDGFRQGTEPIISLPDGFRQGTEPSLRIPDGFRQGTEPIISLPDGFRQGTEPSLRIPDGFRQGTEPSTSRLQTETLDCEGKIISGKCYQFNPTPLAFRDAQSSCRGLAPNADLASVPSGDLHSRLVSMVTEGGKTSPVLTWLGGVVKNQQAQWVDGSEWAYSDWMPGHPNIHTDKPVCLEMFRIDESWWTAVDCELKRASICSYSVAA